ncbi:Transglutaminase-like superfamily protein [Acetitomaculum ruminis DSM 5522]|uniref:Transglutaminase-like superfamily protein n=1 Tax=Acetitomaculum ruminis DSM 5522 TaxID=1120918 RepID=A0A1I0W2X9_9FIRM|nr:Ig-like domain-containing protein [Acetitomaculum ruminis]SFA82971.1 Transglutaminase-like superfamily protein [Acetitomaculum ruminis DSM 5522]
MTNFDNRIKAKIPFLILTLIMCFLACFTLGNKVEAANKKGLDKTLVTMYVGESLTLKISGTKAVSWTSSDSKIVLVKKGKLTAKKAGKAVISCKAKDKKVYKCKVTVKNPCLNVKSKKIHQGKSFTLKLTGAKAKSFKVNNNNVTVDKNGKVSSKKSGSSIITVLDTKKRKYTCKITVEGHKSITVGKYFATCQMEGFTGDEYCTICNKLIKKGSKIPRTDHQLGKTPWFVNEATCESARLEGYNCTYCGMNVTKTVGKPLGHLMEATPSEHENPTCTDEGYNFYYCTREGCYHGKKEEIPALGHDLNLKETIPATCKYGKTDIYVCNRCHEEIRKDDTKLGNHVLEDESIPATCINDGRNAKYCTVCREFITDEVILAKGHHSTLKTDAKGEKYITCEDCGIIFSYSTQLGSEDTWRALNKNHELFLKQGHGGKGGFGSIKLSLANKSWQQLYEEDYNQYEKVQADFWKRVKFEISDENVVKRLIDNGAFTYDGKNETYNKSAMAIGLKHGTSQVKVYWDDVLYDSFTVNVGGSLMEMIKELLKDNPDETMLYGCDNEITEETIRDIAKLLKTIITDDMTDYQKVLAIKNWYDKNITYEDPGNDAISFIEIFGNHRGKCHDYAISFSLLMSVLDIDCYYVRGPSDNGDGNLEYHAWNMVYLDAGNGKGKQWYYADTTWHEFDTTKTVKELNEKDGYGRYNTVDGKKGYRISEAYKKCTEDDFYGNSQEVTNDGEAFTDFKDFEF